MVETLSEAQIAAWKEAFAVLDKDEDGRLSAADLRKLLTSNGEHAYTEQDSKTVVDKFDSVGDGGLDFVEFLAFVGAHAKSGMLKSGTLSPGDDEKQLRAAFERLSGGADSVSLAAFADTAKKLKEPWTEGNVGDPAQVSCLQCSPVGISPPRRTPTRRSPPLSSCCQAASRR